MRQFRRSRFFVSIISALFIATLIFPAFASAESAETLVNRLPGNNKLIVGVDVKSVKGSPLYKQGMQWIRTQSSLTELLTLIEVEGGFDLDKDLQSIAVVSPELPADADSAKDMSLIMALSGKFDREKISAVIKSRIPGVTESKEAKLNILTADNNTLSFIDDKTLVIVSGSKSYQSNSWQGIGAKKSTHNAQYKTIVADVVKEHGIWILMDSSSMTAAGAQGAKANFSAFAVRAKENVALTMLSHFQDESSAGQAVREAQNLKSEAQSNPMLSMAGLGPILKTLAIKQDKSKVWITSSMTVAEAALLMTRVQSIMQRSQTLKSSPSTSGSKSQEIAPIKKDASPTKKSGAAADFN